ncbi:MAG: 6-pyruvoyl tetrahydrobiopterin synthase [Ignavibacteria bacterium]
MVYITRKEHFSASHRLHNPALSDEQNRALYGKCNNPNGHGHNYEIEVTLAGIPPQETGMVMDLKRLSDIINEEIIELVDHKHLNHDVDFLRGIIPTAENMAVAFWKRLQTKIEGGKLYSIRLYESDNNFVEYRGE